MAPTLTTVDSYWKVVFQNNASLIVQLCPEEENNKVSFFYLHIVCDRKCAAITMSRHLKPLRVRHSGLEANL